MVEVEDFKDSITVGTAGTGGAVKAYIDFSTMTDEEIEKIADRVFTLATKLKILHEQQKVRMKG